MSGSRPLRRRSHEVDRDRRRRVFRLELFGIILDAVDQRLARRPEVRAAGIVGGIGHGDSFRRIVRVGLGRRRGTAVEIFVIRKVLADQLGADHRAVLLDQAAIGLVREEELREPGHAERVDKTGDDGHDDDHHDGGTDLSQHGG